MELKESTEDEEMEGTRLQTKRKKTEERRKDELAEMEADTNSQIDSETITSPVAQGKDQGKSAASLQSQTDIQGPTVPETSNSNRRATMTADQILRYIAPRYLEIVDASHQEERNNFLSYLQNVRRVLSSSVDIQGATVPDTSNRIAAMATTSSESGSIGNERIPSKDVGLSAFKSLPTFDVSRPEDESAIPERQLECQSDRTKIHEGIVTRTGTIWDLKQGAAYLMLPPDAVSKPTSIAVHKWKCSTRSPPLQEHEAIVSNVIEISTNANRALEFNVEVTLLLCHSAADLQGYELVLKRLVNNGNNEWEDVDGTQVLEHFSEIEDEHPSVKDVPDVFPAVQAEIIECSTYAVVSRLKSSPLYTVTSDGGSFNHPNYPGVLITIPKKAVPPKRKFSLQVKVQEVPSEAFDDDNVMVGPILRIACSQSIEFLKPVIIQLPVSHQHGGISQSLECRVRVLFLRSDGERKEWIEITDDLENPPNYDGKFVRFQVERFSGYSYTLDWNKGEPTGSRILRVLSSLIWNPPMRAVFFAYFFSSEEEEEEVVVRLICCPNHLRIELTSELERKLVTFSTVKSVKRMIPECDKAFVCVSGGISPINEEDMNEFHLVFDGGDWCDRQLPVRVISELTLSKVQFHSTPERARKDWLAELYLRVNIDREALNNPQSIHDSATSTENPGNRGLAFGCISASRKRKRKLATKGTSTENPGNRRLAFGGISASRKRKRKLATKGTSADYHEDPGFAFACTSSAKQSKLASEVTKFNDRSKDDLERLSRKIADNWKPLARRLGFDEPNITAFDQENGRLARKAHPMLLAWHRREGSAATYQVLYDALCDDLVECKALAEELCYS